MAAGRINDEDVVAVRDRASIEDVVGSYVALRNAGGGSLKGLCPFHDEKTPSFQVTPARGFFYCFGCGEGGDVITFTGPQPAALQDAVQERLGVVVNRVDQMLRIERPAAHLFVPHLIEAAPGLIDSVTVGRPTLDDVFVRLTGRRLHRPAAD